MGEEIPPFLHIVPLFIQLQILQTQRQLFNFQESVLRHLVLECAVNLWWLFVVAMGVRNRDVKSTEANGTIHTDEKIKDAKTDHTRWRLRDDRGRQTWHYLQSDEDLKQWPMTVADKYFLGMDTVSIQVLSESNDPHLSPRYEMC